MNSQTTGAGPTTQPPRLNGLRVLIADDNPDIVLSLRLILEHAGYQVLGSRDGAEVLQEIDEFEPDAVILDIGMPLMSGYAVAQELRRRYGARAPLMIAISGQWRAASEKLLASSVGFDHFLEKPADPRTVLALLEPLLTRRDKR